MQAADWGHFSIVSEWFSFFLITPEFISPERLEQWSKSLKRVAVHALRMRDLQTFRIHSQINAEEMNRRFQTLGKEAREMWRHETGRLLFLSLTLPAPSFLLLLIGVFLFKWPFRWAAWISIGLYAVGQLILTLIVHGRIRVPSSQQRPAILQLLIAFLILLPLSVNVWSALIPAYALSTLSRESTLRAMLFWVGVALFTASKGIEYVLTH